MRLLISGGGTAGHIYPLLAVVEKIKQKITNERLEILYLGSKKGIEEKIMKNKNIPSIFIHSGKWRRYWPKWLPALLLNFRDLFLIILGFFEAFFIMVKFHPDILFAKGGYVTLPVVFAAKICGIPIISHESDVVMGLSNRITAKMSEMVCVSFPLSYYPHLPQKKLVYTGNPIREGFYPPKIKAKTKKSFPVVLVIGGSQGAQRINETVTAIVPQLVERIKFIHITGDNKAEQAKKVRDSLPPSFKKNYLIYEFVDQELPDLMREADLVISRAGANVLAEIAVCQRPSILIPLKNAAANHQEKNAQIFAQRQAAVVIREDNLSEKKLLNTILELLNNKKRLSKMQQNVISLAKPEAAERIAEEILNLRI